jgi:predicted RNA-binding Zn-ribbon protein involved in translation (DUF1610 family)
MCPSEIEFCPACGKTVEETEIMDIHAAGFRCHDGHYLHFLKTGVYTSETMGRYLSLTSGKELPEDILKEWLLNPSLRDHLNDNLAGIVRHVLEQQNGKVISTETLKYTYCPSCGEVLQDVTPKEELYLAVLKCKGNHEFSCRGGMSVAGSRTNLSFDYDENYFRRSFKAWMEDRDFTLRVHSKSANEVVAFCFPSGFQKVGPNLYEAHENNFRPSSDLSIYFGNSRRCNSNGYGEAPNFW